MTNRKLAFVFLYDGEEYALYSSAIKMPSDKNEYTQSYILIPILGETGCEAHMVDTVVFDDAAEELCVIAMAFTDRRTSSIVLCAAEGENSYNKAVEMAAPTINDISDKMMYLERVILVQYSAEQRGRMIREVGYKKHE